MGFGAGVLALASCAAPPPAGRDAATVWTDLFDGQSLRGFASTEFGGEGDVAVVDGAIHLGIGSPLTGITWQGELPTLPYELEVIARRRSGADFFCGLTFPVGSAPLTLVLGGWGGSVCGLSSLDGLDAAHNATRTLRHFATGVDYRVRVRVTADAIAAWIDDVPLLEAPLAGRALGVRPEVELSRPLGLCSFATAAAVRGLRWRPLPPR
jgi:hypothetical protein